MIGCVKSVESIYFNPSGGLSQTITLTKGQVVANCVPMVTYQFSGTGTDASRWRVDVYFPNSTQIKIERTTATDNLAGRIFVVEFDPNRVRVQQGSFTCLDEAAYPQTTNVTLAQTVDTSKAAVVAYYRPSLTSTNWDTHALRFWLSSTTFNANRAEGDDTALYGHYYVFESLAGNFTVQQKNLIFTGSDSLKSDTITAVNENKSFVVSSTYTTNNGTNFGYSTFDVKLVGGSSVEAERALAGSYTIVRVVIIEFHDDTTVRHGDISFGSGDIQDDSTIVEVDTDYASVVNTGSVGTLRINTGTPRLGMCDQHLTSSTNFRALRNASGSVAEGRYQVVEFAQAPGYYFGGTVAEQAVPSDPVTPVVTTVRAYRRDTGDFVGEATSSGTGGSYYLETTYSGAHYVVALDPAGGESYNILGYDLVVPTTISGG